MHQQDFELARAALRTPRAAAMAGIAFALLYGSSLVLIRLAVRTEPVGEADWIAQNLNAIRISLALLPFAGIAFLWFIGVVRDRLGQWEDQFFSTVFFGSGILLIAMYFISGALAGGLMNVYMATPQLLQDDAVFAVNQASVYQLINVYGIKMAGVFMMSLATIWRHTGFMPRWFVLMTYVLALLLLLITLFNTWITLVFPVWVLILSVHILLKYSDGAQEMRKTGSDTTPV